MPDFLKTDVPFRLSSTLGYLTAAAGFVLAIVKAIETSDAYNGSVKWPAALGAIALVITNYGRQQQAPKAEAVPEAVIPPEVATLAQETAATHTGDGTDSPSVPFSGAS